MLFPCFQICGTMRLFARSKRLQVSFGTDSTPNPSSRRWQSERRHVDQPRQRNYYQVLQGGYPPEGPMAEVLRAEAKTAGNSQRVCRPRISTAAPSWGPRRSPAKRVRWGEGGAKERNVVFGFSRKRNGADFAPTRGPGPQARRSLVTFHRWKVTRRRLDQKTKRRE